MTILFHKSAAHADYFLLSPSTTICSLSRMLWAKSPEFCTVANIALISLTLIGSEVSALVLAETRRSWDSKTNWLCNACWDNSASKLSTADNTGLVCINFMSILPCKRSRKYLMVVAHSQTCPCLLSATSITSVHSLLSSPRCPQVPAMWSQWTFLTK